MQRFNKSLLAILLLSSSVASAQVIGPVAGGGGGGGGTPGGSTGAIQYNNAGSFGGVNITGLIKGNGTGAPTAAISGVDYAPATTGTSVLLGDGSGGFNNATLGNSLALSGTNLFNTVLIRSVTGTTDTILSTDNSKIVTYANAGAIAVTLPQATGSFAAGFGFTVQNTGVGSVTITPTTSTINGAASLVVATDRGCDIVSDGTNWKVAACTALVSGGSSGTVNSGTAGNGAYYATTGTAVSDAGAVQTSFGGITLTGGTAPANGFYLSSGNTIMVRAASGNMLQFSSAGTSAQSTISSSNAAGFSIQNGASSSTVPVYVSRTQITTGIGFAASATMNFIVASVNKAQVTAEGIQYKQTTAPAVTGTGTPTIATGSTDEAGEVTSGASATSVVITFNLAHTNAPFCVVTQQGNPLAAFAYTLSNTAITITQTATSGNKIDYRCTFP